MRLSVRYFHLCCFLGLAGATHDLSEDEQYLEPYLNELIDFRDNEVSDHFVSLADLVDASPTFIPDIIIPKLIPGSSLTIPVNEEIKIKIHTGPIPLPVTFTLVDVTLNNLNHFKSLRPGKLLDSGKFTWHSVIEMSQLDVVVRAKVRALRKTVEVNVSMPLKDPSIDMKTIVAFNRSRLCDVWGDVMKSSLECALWPLSHDESAGVSGVNVTDLTVSISDFDVQMTVHGLGINDSVLQNQLEQALQEVKPSLIGNLSGSISQSMRSFANGALLSSIPKYQQENPCQTAPEEAPSAVINVSRMCVSNNAAFVVKFKAHDCPARSSSSQTSGYPIDQSRCMDVSEAFPQAVEGDILRVQTEAVLGLHKLLDPAIRYVPNSNAAAWQCSGTTMDYHCGLMSVAPINPSVAPRVHRVCIINHAGFVMNYELQNSRTGGWVPKTSNYPINQNKCIDLGNTDGVQEGDEFHARVHAVLGKTNMADRSVLYYNNGLTATYECKGTTLFYHCNLLVSEEEGALLV